MHDHCMCCVISLQRLLQFGADTELRDEDGHTPLDKAQERGDEWYQQCLEIFENPGNMLIPIYIYPCTCTCL